MGLGFGVWGLGFGVWAVRRNASELCGLEPPKLASATSDAVVNVRRRSSSKKGKLKKNKRATSLPSMDAKNLYPTSSVPCKNAPFKPSSTKSSGNLKGLGRRGGMARQESWGVLQLDLSNHKQDYCKDSNHTSTSTDTTVASST